MANHSQKMFARYLSDKLIPEKRMLKTQQLKKKKQLILR